MSVSQMENTKGQALYPVECMSCGKVEYVTVGKGINSIPICSECMKNRKPSGGRPRVV